MKTLMSATAAIVAISLTPTIAAASNYNAGYDAHEACKRGEDNRQIVGGLAGAVIGGVVGSQVSGNGARTEGSAIGAVLGGLAGAGIADKSIDCDPNYGHQTTSAPSTQTVYAPTQTVYASSQGYNTTPTYGTTQTQYEDRVTVSNHPVYSDPYYGAGAVSQGQTYSTGTVTYPPSGHNTQYASQTYSAPSVVHSEPVTQPIQATTTRYYSASQPVVHSAVYRSAAQPSYAPAPSYRTVRPYRAAKPYRRAHQTHYHGRYSCGRIH